MTREIHTIEDCRGTWEVHGSGPDQPADGAVFTFDRQIVAVIEQRHGRLHVIPVDVSLDTSVAGPMQLFRLNGLTREPVLLFSPKPRPAGSSRAVPDPSALVGAFRTSDAVPEHGETSGPRRRQTIGTVCHAVVGQMASRVHPEVPTLDYIDRAVRRNFTASKGPAARGALADCFSAAVAYMRFAWPPADWSLVEVEADRPPGGRCDLVWRTGSGTIVGDELKTGWAVTSSARRQVDLQLDVLLPRYGNVAGVRLFVAGNPRSSLLLRASGSWEQLADTDLWFANTVSRDGSRR